MGIAQIHSRIALSCKDGLQQAKKLLGITIVRNLQCDVEGEILDRKISYSLHKAKTIIETGARITIQKGLIHRGVIGRQSR